MRAKTLPKKASNTLGLWSRIKLLFGIPPKTLAENRALFKGALHDEKPGIFWASLDVLIQGKIYMFSPMWIRVYQAWVDTCGENMSELKDAFYSTGYCFVSELGGTPDEIHPLREIVVEAILPLIDTESKNLHCSEPDLYYIVTGGNGHSPALNSPMRKASILKYCKLSAGYPGDIYHISQYITPGSPAHDFCTKELGLQIIN